MRYSIEKKIQVLISQAFIGKIYVRIMSITSQTHYHLTISNRFQNCCRQNTMQCVYMKKKKKAKLKSKTKSLLEKL